MAGQPSAPDDYAVTLLPAEPHRQDTVFMVRVQRRFQRWGLMVRRRVSAVSNHATPLVQLIPSRRAFRAPQSVRIFWQRAFATAAML